MNSSTLLSTQDRSQLAEVGIEPDEVERQLHLLRNPPQPAELVAPCTIGDGIVSLSSEQQSSYVERWRALANQRTVVKLVPASGAATRMFRDLTDLESEETLQRFRQGLGPSKPNFAFRQELLQRLAHQNPAVDPVAAREQIETAIQYLLSDSGMGYRQLPKGLIPFHTYPQGTRTALVEHLWEGAPYLQSSDHICRFHFTVTAEHELAFRDHIDQVRPQVPFQLEVEFSNQSRATDTIAVDLDGRPFRDADGSLLLRPAGHGALLENIEQVEADVVIIKNIDNIAHQRLHETSIHWKKVLVGYFAQLQEEIFDELAQLEASPDSPEAVNRALDLLQEKVCLRWPANLVSWDLPDRSRLARRLLDRPLRVCGMVENAGEPGGGPFWVRNQDGEVTGQIIEGAQVDSTSADQMAIWGSSTHFNPVDLVCGLRDRHGKPYHLADSVDPTTAFVTEKSHHGQSLRALERPGLWNGSMALWNTAFVEVPLSTFTPVKTVFDLLRPEHQP